MTGTLSWAQQVCTSTCFLCPKLTLDRKVCALCTEPAAARFQQSPEPGRIPWCSLLTQGRVHFLPPTPHTCPKGVRRHSEGPGASLNEVGQWAAGPAGTPPSKAPQMIRKLKILTKERAPNTEQPRPGTSSHQCQHLQALTSSFQQTDCRPRNNSGAPRPTDVATHSGGFAHRFLSITHGAACRLTRDVTDTYPPGIFNGYIYSL